MKGLLIRNARVIDPSQNLDALQDILIQDGMIQDMGKGLSADEEEIMHAQ